MESLAAPLAPRIVSVARAFSMRGWTLGSCGSLSVLLNKDPFQLLLTPDETDFGLLQTKDVLLLDKAGQSLSESKAKPSSDSAIHLEILRNCGVRAIFHTASVWDLLIAEANDVSGGLFLQGFHALSKVCDGEGTLFIPIVPFRLDSGEQCTELKESLRVHAPAPAVLIRGRGLYCWGRDFEEAKRKTEVLEMLIETCARARYTVYQSLAQAPTPREKDQAEPQRATSRQLRLVR